MPWIKNIFWNDTAFLCSGNCSLRYVREITRLPDLSRLRHYLQRTLSARRWLSIWWIFLCSYRCACCPRPLVSRRIRCISVRSTKTCYSILIFGRGAISKCNKVIWNEVWPKTIACRLVTLVVIFDTFAGHVQFLQSFVRRDKKFFKKRFGVQFFVDVIRKHLSGNDITNAEATKTVRVTIIGIINYYIQKELSVQEINAIVGYVIVCHQSFQVRCTRGVEKRLKSVLGWITFNNARQCVKNLLHSYLRFVYFRSSKC